MPMAGAPTARTRTSYAESDAMAKFTGGRVTSSEKQERFRHISADIERVGYHVKVVQQERIPRFAYTIGLSHSVGAELVFPGASIFLLDDLLSIMGTGAEQVRKRKPSISPSIDAGGHGGFTFGHCHDSWVKLLMLDAVEYLRDQEISAYQIRPDTDHVTIDVPDMTVPWNPRLEFAWQWLTEPWDFSIPSNSTAVTNFAALRGDRVTEASRWEEDQWDLFAGSGPDTPKEEARVVPIGTLLGVDPTLASALSLDIGKSLWRDADELKWHHWGS
jgi:hypothetical protein